MKHFDEVKLEFSAFIVIPKDKQSKVADQVRDYFSQALKTWYPTEHMSVRIIKLDDKS